MVEGPPGGGHSPFQVGRGSFRDVYGSRSPGVRGTRLPIRVPDHPSLVHLIYFLNERWSQRVSGTLVRQKRRGDFET